MQKIKIVCTSCGSETGIRADAYADWNIEKQQWELCAVFDDRTCADCGDNNCFEEKEIKTKC